MNVGTRCGVCGTRPHHAGEIHRRFSSHVDTANKSRGRWTILLDRENGILAQEIVERLVRAADGSLVLATVGSTRAIASTVTHAGIVRVRRFAFDLPAATEEAM